MLRREIMLTTLKIRSYVCEAANAAPVEPCWHQPLDSGRLAGSRIALVERCMR
jgi:hypothetical protein